jgi:hypothetical protein
MYGPHTNALHERLAEAVHTHYLDISHLDIHTLPPLPDTLEELRCQHIDLAELPTLPPSLRYLLISDTPYLTHLPALPASLRHLACWNIPLTELPPLPPHLERLTCAGADISTLPSLPPTLKWLACDSTPLSVLPPLPASLQALYCMKCPNLRFRQQSSRDATCPAYRSLWNDWHIHRAHTIALKECLIAAVFHPRRVAAWLEMGGHPLVEHMMG